MYKRFFAVISLYLFADFPAHLFTRVFFQILFCGFLWIKFILWIEIASNNYDKKSANPFKRKSVNEKDLMKNLRKHCLPFQIKITSNLYNLNKSLFFHFIWFVWAYLKISILWKLLSTMARNSIILNNFSIYLVFYLKNSIRIFFLKNRWADFFVKGFCFKHRFADFPSHLFAQIFFQILICRFHVIIIRVDFCL